MVSRKKKQHGRRLKKNISVKTERKQSVGGANSDDLGWFEKAERRAMKVAAEALSVGSSKRKKKKSQKKKSQKKKRKTKRR
jgi:hypothetical protein